MTIVCHGCNTANSDSAEFCKQCGTLMRLTQKADLLALAPAAAPEAALLSALATAAKVPCPQCSHANSQAARFCTSCGGSMVAAAKPAADLHREKAFAVVPADLPATPMLHLAPAIAEGAAPLVTAFPDIDDSDNLELPQRIGNTAAMALALAVVVAAAGLVGGGWFWWTSRPSAADNSSSIAARQPQSAVPAPITQAAPTELHPHIVTEMKDGTTLVEPAAAATTPDSTTAAVNTAHSTAPDASNNTLVATGNAGRATYENNVAAPAATKSLTTGATAAVIGGGPAGVSAPDAAAAQAQRKAERRANAALAAYQPSAQNTVPPAVAYYPAAPTPAPLNAYQPPQQVVTVVSSPPAGSGSPREGCSGQPNAALASCISRQCQLPRFFNHPQCGTLRRDRESEDRQEQLRN